MIATTIINSIRVKPDFFFKSLDMYRTHTFPRQLRRNNRVAPWWLALDGCNAGPVPQ
jgi:hypothetical protein